MQNGSSVNGHSTLNGHSALNGHKTSSEPISASSASYPNNNGHSTSLVEYSEPPVKYRREAVKLQTAAQGEGLEKESERPFWADDPPPPPKRNFFKKVDPASDEEAEAYFGTKAVKKSPLAVYGPIAAVVFLIGVMCFAGYRYATRPKPILDAQPKAMVGNWLSDDGTLTVEMQLAANGTGRITWHVHGFMPAGISTLGDVTYHWSQNAQKKIVFHEDTPFDLHLIYPPGVIQNMVAHQLSDLASGPFERCLDLQLDIPAAWQRLLYRFPKLTVSSQLVRCPVCGSRKMAVPKVGGGHDRDAVFLHGRRHGHGKCRRPRRNTN